MKQLEFLFPRLAEIVIIEPMREAGSHGRQLELFRGHTLQLMRKGQRLRLKQTVSAWNVPGIMCHLLLPLLTSLLTFSFLALLKLESS
ncbi:hypothetical protein SLA2020_360470 [Shorea laevis]